MSKKSYVFPKRIKMMIARNIPRVPWMFIRMMTLSDSKRISIEKKYDIVREIAYYGCKSGNVTVHATGFEQLDDINGYILYPNHQGLFDVMGIVDNDPHPFSVVIKKETEKIFGLHQLVSLLDGLYIDREDPRQGLAIINEVAERAKNGRNTLIFAEGTRSKNGNQVGEFKGGSFKAATKSKCPIVPIAIIDSYLPFDKNTTEQTDVYIHLLKPILYEEYQGMKTTEIAEMVRSRIVDRIEQQVKENENPQ